MDFQSQIELKVKVLDKELADLEKRIAKVANPFTASGGRRNDKRLAAAKTAQKAELNLIKQAVEEEDRLRETKAQKRVQTNLRRIRFLRDQRIKAARESEAKAEQLARKRRRGIQGLQLGIGFPLLFGGGVGAVAGGALGSSGGFGGQILGSAVGQQIDDFIASTAKLGQALNPIVADVDTLTKALGATGTETERYISTLQQSDQEMEAFNFAMEKLSELVGKQGVGALEDFGKDSQNLTNEMAKFFTQVQAGIAGLINATGILKAAVDGIGRSVTINAAKASRGKDRDLDAALDALAAEESSPQAGLQGMGIAGFIPQPITDAELNVVKEYNKTLQQTGEIVNKIFQDKQRELVLEEGKLNAAEAAFALSKNANKIAQLGGDIKNATVFELQKQNVELEYQIKIQDILNEKADDALKIAIRQVKLDAITNNRAADLADLEFKRNKAIAASNKKASKSKALQLQQQLVREELKRAEIAVKRVSLIVDEETAIEGQQLLLQRRLNDETKIIELQREQALAQNKVAGDIELINRLKDSQLETLQKQLELEKATNNERLRAIRLEKELQSIKNTQELAGISTDLTRQIEDTQFRTNNPFGGDAVEQRELEIEQGRRYADLLTDIADKEELVNAAVRSRLKDGKEATAQQVEELNQLERKKQLYAELIPQLNAAEQAELRMAQTLEMLSPVTNALASGLTDMITGLVDGTKSAEEALSDMFKNIGAAFIQMATEMIAQALVMKALGILMPGAGGGGGGLDLAGVASYMPGGSSYEGGGYTGNAPRSGGVDGRGGFPAILHPNETVIDHESAMGKYSPGGGGAGGGSRTIRFESTTINEVSFVTTEQAMAMSRQAADDGAKRGAAGGHAKTMNTLQNNRSSRARIGMR